MFVSIDLLGPKKRSDLFHKNCQNTLWTPKICFRTFDKFNKKKKKTGQKLFFIAFFSKLCVFNKILGPK